MESGGKGELVAAQIFRRRATTRSRFFTNIKPCYEITVTPQNTGRDVYRDAYRADRANGAQFWNQLSSFKYQQRSVLGSGRRRCE